MILGKFVLMRLILRALIIIGALAILTTQAWADAEIVIAIRYLQAEGTSHSHLYLYREDGKLLRQLTNDNSGQDSGPIFAEDGGMIIFTREKPNDVHEFWSIEPRGTHLKKLDAAPDWYTQAKSSPYFTNIEPEESPSPSLAASPEESASPVETPPPTYKSPDNSVELVLREDPKDEDDEGDGPGHGKHYLLRDLKTGAETEFDKLPGFYGVFGLLHEKQNKDQHFLFDGPLRLAFFDLHLNSTAVTRFSRSTSLARDLSGYRPIGPLQFRFPVKPRFSRLQRIVTFPSPAARKRRIALTWNAGMKS